MPLLPGSIAFVGFNADGNDNLAFVALTNIAAGETLIFEDNEWNGTAFSDTGENAFRWTATSDVAAGAVVRIDNVGSGILSTDVGAVEAVDARGTNRGVGNSNEVIYVYQGDAASPTFITALANSGFSAATGVLTGTGLTVGVNALDLSVLDDGLDVAAYTGARSGQGSFNDYAAVINNPASWIAQDASGDQSADAIAPDVPFSATAFTLGAAPPPPVTDFGGIKVLSMAQSLEGDVATPVANESVSVVRKGGYVSGDGLGGAESIAFDPTLDRAFVTNGARDRIDILDLSNPAAPAKVGFLDLPGSVPGFSYGGVNAVAVSNGLVAVALQNADGGENGVVALFNGATGAFVKAIEVGVLPDHLTFNPDGSLLIVGNEGQPFLDLNTGTVDNATGSVSIISIPGNPADAVVRNTVGFTALDAFENELDALGLKTYDGGTLTVSVGALNATINVADPTVSKDIEPEYIAVSPDGTRAFVTLQEVNAVAVIDLTNTGADKPVSILPLGFVDFSLPGNQADFSDRDGPGNTPSISVSNGPIKSLLQPDAIASFEVGGVTYFITANEGDSRIVGSSTFDDPSLNEARASNLATAPTSDFARLNLDTVWSTPTDLYAFGGRGFSIFRVDNDGSIIKVEETGGDFDQILAALPNAATVFNGEHGGGFDSRSDNKGGEPEGVAVGEVDGKMLAFVNLERAGGLMVWDVSVPEDAKFVRYIPPTSEDFGPEVLTFVSAQDSPNGRALVLSANEVTGSMTVYEASSPTAPVNYTLQILHLADAEAGLLASSTAKNLAAMVDAYEDDFANTLILSGGDNFIPGPFLSAGTDPSVIPTLNSVSGSTIGANANVPIGAVDTAILNAIGVQVSAIGNHEFDLGSRVFRDSFNPASGWVGADYAMVSANLDFSGDGDLASRFTQTMGNGDTPTPEASTLKGRIAPAVVVTEGGEKIGIVGATTQILEAISSPSGTEVAGFPTGPGANGEVDNMALLAAQLQPIIDELRAEGVNKIILQAHLQNINNEKQLASLLKGVDIILAAGSNTRLGDANDEAVAFPGHAANFADTYPLTITDAEGGTTLIVNTDNEFTYLGRLKVDFDADGKIIVDNLVADAAINGAYASTAANVAEAWNVNVADLETTAFADGTKGDKVRDLTDAVQGVISSKDGSVSGYTDVYLEGERLFVRGQETNLGSLSADANAFAYRSAAADADEIVVSMKNGGGIRAQIGTLSAPDPVDGSVDKLPPPANPDANKLEGGVSQLDIENSLRFNNRLMAFETTPEGLKAILEHGVAAGTGQGRFPQIGGVSFSWDPDNAANSRVSDVAVFDAEGNKLALFDNGVLADGAPSKITVVTLNFLANGGDSYPMKANGENFRYLLDDGSLSAPVDESLDFTSATVIASFTPAGVNLLGEQQAFAEFMQEFHGTQAEAYDVADTPVGLDERIQNLNFREDTVLEGAGVPVDVVASTLASEFQTDQLFVVLTSADLNAAGGEPEEIVYTIGSVADGAFMVNGEFAQVGTQFTQADVNAGRVILFAGAVAPSGAGVSAADGFSFTVSNGVRDTEGSFIANYEAFAFVSSSSGVGTSGDDYLTGSVAADFFTLRSGADTVDAGEGADFIRAIQSSVRVFAGDGDDQIRTGAGNDLIDGGTGADTIDSGLGDDIIFGGAGDDQISSKGGDDLIFGGAGNDSIQTRRGDNVINAGLGNDNVSAGIGANTYILGGISGETSDGDDSFVIRRDRIGDEFALLLKDAAGNAVGFGDDVVQGFQIAQGDKLIAFGDQAGDWDDAGKLLEFAQVDAVRAFRTNWQDLQIVFDAGKANESSLTLAGFYNLNRNSLTATERATASGQELSDDVLAGILADIVDDGQSAQTYLARVYGGGDMLV